MTLIKQTTGASAFILPPPVPGAGAFGFPLHWPWHRRAILSGAPVSDRMRSDGIARLRRRCRPFRYELMLLSSRVNRAAIASPNSAQPVITATVISPAATAYSTISNPSSSFTSLLINFRIFSIFILLHSFGLFVRSPCHSNRRERKPLDRLTRNTDTSFFDFFIKGEKGLFCDGRHNY